jgi:hypothetical protein
VDDRSIPVRRLRFEQTSSGSRHVEPPNKPLFIKGPLSMPWLSVAAKLKGKSLHVAMAIQWLAGMNTGKPFKLTRKALEMFSVSNDAASDGVKRLEAAGHIAVQRLAGQRPTITMRQLSEP